MGPEMALAGRARGLAAGGPVLVVVVAGGGGDTHSESLSQCAQLRQSARR